MPARSSASAVRAARRSCRSSSPSADAAHIDAVQAKEGAGREIWVLDAKARRVVGIAKDGAEDVRVALPTELAEPSGFLAVEEQNFVVSLHGTRLARTDIAR